MKWLAAAIMLGSVVVAMGLRVFQVAHRSPTTMTEIYNAQSVGRIAVGALGTMISLITLAALVALTVAVVTATTTAGVVGAWLAFGLAFVAALISTGGAARLAVLGWLAAVIIAKAVVKQTPVPGVPASIRILLAAGAFAFVMVSFTWLTHQSWLTRRQVFLRHPSDLGTPVDSVSVYVLGSDTFGLTVLAFDPPTVHHLAWSDIDESPPCDLKDVYRHVACPDPARPKTTVSPSSTSPRP